MKKLFSRKNKGEAGALHTPKEKTGLSLVRLNLMAMFIAVLVVLVSGYVAYLQFSSRIAANEAASHLSKAREYAAQLGGRVQALGEEVQRLARADAPLLAAIAAQDGSYLRQREQQLAEAFPDALRIRYLLPSEQDPEDTLVPKLSYACLDLARRAEKGIAPPFEVHLFGSAQQHLDMVRPVYSGNTPVASLMVTLDVKSLQAWLEGIKPPTGYVELQQGSGGDALTLASLGNAALKGQTTGNLAGVVGSSWQLRYWPASGVGMAEAREAGFLLTFAVAAGLLALFYFLFSRFLSRVLRSDLKRLVGFIVDSSLGKRFHSYPVKLAECKQVLKEKEMDLSVLTSHASIAESVRHDHDHDEIPELTFSDAFGGPAEEDRDKGRDDSDTDSSSKKR